MKETSKKYTAHDTADGQHRLSGRARRGMLIPLACLGVFFLVGFASADRRRPRKPTNLIAG